MKEIIEEKLKLNLSPSKIDIEDQSHKHIGHSGWKEGQATHFDVLIVSNKFVNQSRIQRHRCIYKILEEEMNSGIHALAISAFTEDEYSKLL